jgi:hypothetical protein
MVDGGKDAEFVCGEWVVAVNASDGSLSKLQRLEAAQDAETSRERVGHDWVGSKGKLGEVLYQTFTEDDFLVFNRQYTPGYPSLYLSSLPTGVYVSIVYLPTASVNRQMCDEA